MPKIYIAVGHGIKPSGGFDPGTSDAGWTEQTSGDIVVQKAADFIADFGVDVYSEAHTDDPNFAGSAAQANEWGADYVVAVHSDWPGAPSGAFVHWVSDEGKVLADNIYEAIEDFGFPMRPSWHKYRDDLYILKHTHAPCVLVEIGKIGDTMLNEEHELEHIGAALATGILDHLDIDNNISKEESSQESTEKSTESKNTWTEDLVDNLPLVSREHNSRGIYAKRAQGLLVANGRAPRNTIKSDGSLDGIFGPGTEDAVRNFQKSHRLSVDGIVGPNTWTALLSG